MEIDPEKDKEEEEEEGNILQKEVAEQEPENVQEQDGEHVEDEKLEGSEPVQKKVKKEGKAQIPLQRVKKIIQQDEDIGTVRKEALVLISRATELFIEYLTQQAERNCHNAGRKVLKPDGRKSSLFEVLLSRFSYRYFGVYKRLGYFGVFAS